MNQQSPGVAIIGCDLVGGKRAAALGPARLIACADVDHAQAEALAERTPGAVADTVERTLANPAVDIVIVSTTNESMASLGMSWEHPRADQSWSLEWAEFLDNIRLGRQPSAGLDAVRAALDIVGTVYARSGFAFADAALT